MLGRHTSQLPHGDPCRQCLGRRCFLGACTLRCHGTTHARPRQGHGDPVQRGRPRLPEGPAVGAGLRHARLPAARPRGARARHRQRGRQRARAAVGAGGRGLCVDERQEHQPRPHRAHRHDQLMQGEQAVEAGASVAGADAKVPPPGQHGCLQRRRVRMRERLRMGAGGAAAPRHELQTSAAGSRRTPARDSRERLWTCVAVRRIIAGRRAEPPYR
mmetsp:Transcript_108298/g.316804  ORF Transcript_108298/g.316804 Transcript_108298/m.316804 type:complete len:216 (+) Transcript_108298:737-1384(+)